MQNPKRLFIAIEVPEYVKEALTPTLSGLNGVQWHPSKNFHITIKFIGETNPELVPHLESLMDFVAANFTAFDLSFSRLKVVESRLRLLVGNPDTVVRMREVVEHNLKKIGLYHDDMLAFEPHITLGKVPRDFIPPEFNFSGVAFPVKEFALYETIKGATAAEFVSLKTSHLI